MSFGKGDVVSLKIAGFFLLHQARVRKITEIGGKSRKEVAHQLALRNRHSYLHRHTLLLDKWFLLFVADCVVLGFRTLANTSVACLPPCVMTALETTCGIQTN